eukprot:883253-Rhodomonas_salina.2
MPIPASAKSSAYPVQPVRKMRDLRLISRRCSPGAGRGTMEEPEARDDWKACSIEISWYRDSLAQYRSLSTACPEHSYNLDHTRGFLHL